MSPSDVLRQVWLFSGLAEEQLDAISSFTFQKTFEPGEMIVEEGRTGNGMYIIMSGRVEVVKGKGTENSRVLAERGPEEIFGEMSLLGEWPRTATVLAVDQVECLGLGPVGVPHPAGASTPIRNQDAADPGATLERERCPVGGMISVSQSYD